MSASSRTGVDKVIVRNRMAQAAKYGTAGLAAVDAALLRLAAADAARGLATKVFDIDDAAQMHAVGGAAVANAGDEREAKQAVDAIYVTHAPDYIVLVDGPDVVPHIKLAQPPGVTDSDRDIPSDLPYACASGFHRNASSYLAATRVVGRLPAAEGENDASIVVGLIDAVALHQVRQAADYRAYFAISADVWRTSSQLNLSTLFGNHSGLKLSPRATHPGIDPSLSALTHFINCHGAIADDRFYGEKAGKYPVAMQSGRIAPSVRRGTVIAAECCYGAQLYDYRMLMSARPICLDYLIGGAAAMIGSTNIAYGPAASNAQADLMVQYFLEDVLAGASFGRAMLQARQRFVRTESMANPLNLKTLAQFVLYGDPSLCAVSQAVAPGTDWIDAGARAELTAALPNLRKSRRMDLIGDGMATASAASLPGRGIDGTSSAAEKFRGIAKRRGFRTQPTFHLVTGGSQFRAAAKALDGEALVAIAIEQQETPEPSPFPSYRAIVGHILGDGIIRIEESESR